MEFEDVFFRSQMLKKKREEAFKNEMIGSAFVGWQMGAGSDKKGKNKPFHKYLESLGLGDKEEIDKDEKQNIAEKAYETGERVMNLFKGKIK